MHLSLAIKLENEYTYTCDSDQKSTENKHVYTRGIVDLLRIEIGSSIDLLQMLF